LGSDGYYEDCRYEALKPDGTLKRQKNKGIFQLQHKMLQLIYHKVSESRQNFPETGNPKPLNLPGIFLSQLRKETYFIPK